MSIILYYMILNGYKSLSKSNAIEGIYSVGTPLNIEQGVSSVPISHPIERFIVSPWKKQDNGR